MIHTGLPFYNPFIGVGGVALNWALQTQPSPPTSPPSSPGSIHRLSSFSIDAILGRRQHHHATDGGGVARGLERRREERLSRSAPYPSTQLPGTCSHSSIRENPSTVTSVSGGGGCSKTKAKRVRTIFTAEQLERLETEFAHQQYMVGPERLYLAAGLQLTEAQVKVWFQNRRIKWRKAVQEQNQARFSSRTPTDEGDPKTSLPTSPLRLNEESSSSNDSHPKPESDERLLQISPSVTAKSKADEVAAAESNLAVQQQRFSNLILSPRIGSPSHHNTTSKTFSSACASDIKLNVPKDI